MRLCRFNDDRLGLVRDGFICDVTSVLDGLPSVRYPYPHEDGLIANLPQLRPRIERLGEASGTQIPVDDVVLLSPVANPGKVVAAPVNYTKHLDEARADPNINFAKQVPDIGQLGLFLKATSSVVGAGEGVAIRLPERRNDHEVELAVVIGTRADRVSAEDALSHVAGYCIGLDMTIRGPEDKSFRKSLDTFTVLGPWLVTSDEFADPENAGLALRVNGAARQDSNTRYLVVGVSKLIAWASSIYTLMPGDVLLTGTPEGVGPVEPGDVMQASVEGIGSMAVRVRAAEPPSMARGKDR